jgi:hypothetical protein
VTPRLLRGRRMSVNRPAQPRRSSQPLLRVLGPSCRWGATPTSGMAYASPGRTGRIRNAPIFVLDDITEHGHWDWVQAGLWSFSSILTIALSALHEDVTLAG